MADRPFSIEGVVEERFGAVTVTVEALECLDGSERNEPIPEPGG
jgi:hypothetical protein